MGCGLGKLASRSKCRNNGAFVSTRAHRRQRDDTYATLLNARAIPAATARGGCRRQALTGFLGVPVAAATTGASSPAAPSASCPWVASTAPISQRVAQLMASMSLSQEMSMVEGHGTANPLRVLHARDLLAVHTRVRARRRPGRSRRRADRRHSTGSARGAGRHLGSVAGAAVRPGDRRRGVRHGSHVNLGPTVNIDRDPRWGRSFEALSEDPALNSALDVAEINGVQSQDVMSQVKHFDAYNQETDRNTRPTTSSWTTERCKRSTCHRSTRR